MTRNLSLYFHIPFCRGKCPYCDFYSVRDDEAKKDALLYRFLSEIAARAKETEGYTVSTVYFGGGTPPLFGAERIAQVLDACRAHFSFSPVETTVECNPGSTTDADLAILKEAGVNRLSIGMQSGDDAVLRAIGRKHHAVDAESLFLKARDTGFQNLSLDLMLGVPGETTESLDRSLSVIEALRPEHVSAYLLKVEEDTPFYKNRYSLETPDEDTLCDRYFHTVETLCSFGLLQYEVSNFAKPGFESKHNSGYWTLVDYLGFGPAAHSCFKGKRFYYPRDLSAYLAGSAPTGDGDGGGYEEKLFLGLRLSAGVSVAELQAMDEMKTATTLKKAAPLLAQGVLVLENGRLKICSQFLLLMNTIISEILP